MPFTPRNESSKLPGYIVIFLLAALGIFQALPAAMPTSNAQSSSCPSNQILHITMYGGVPSNFNILGHYNPGGFFTTYLQDLSGSIPITTPQGVPLNYSTAASSITSNSNFTVWTITLKNLTWSDGTTLTSADYTHEWSSNFALSPQYDPIGIHSEVTSVTAPNSNTVVFNPNTTDAHFPEKMSNIFSTVLYPQSFTAQGGGYNGLTNSSVGVGPALGPFVIQNYQPGQSQLIMTRNPNFKPQPIGVCEIVWNFVESETQDAVYIASGSSDLAPVDPTSAQSLISSGNPNVHILTQPDVWISYIGYNTSSYPYNMTQFRQALVYGINQSKIASQAWQGYGVPAYNAEGSVPADSSLYNPNQMKYNFSQTTALSLLHSIGFTGGGSSSTPLKYPNGTSVSLTLWASSDVASDSTIAGFIKTDLTNLGITVSLQLTSYSTIVGYLNSNANDILNELTLHTSNALYPSNAYYDAQQAPLTYGLTEPLYANYMWPANINKQYLSNLSAITATNNPANESLYLSNIQALYAQYLPELNLAYAGNTYAYSTAHFTGWPGANGYAIVPYSFNYTMLENLTPTSGSTQTTTTTPTTSTTGGGGGTTSTTTSSSTSSGGSPVALDFPALLAILAIIVVGTGALTAKRRQ